MSFAYLPCAGDLIVALARSGRSWIVCNQPLIFDNALQDTLLVFSKGELPPVSAAIIERVSERFCTDENFPPVEGKESLSTVFATMHRRDLDFLAGCGKWPLTFNFNTFVPFGILAVKGQYATAAAVEVIQEKGYC